MKEELKIIKQMKAPIFERWQIFLGLIIPIQLKAVKECGFSADQSGLALYNERLMALSVENIDLFNKNKEKWDFLLKEAFDVFSYKTLNLEETQKLVEKISYGMQGENFLIQVDKFASSIHPSTPLPMKRKQLLNLLFSLQKEIIEGHGLDGDEGYVIAQKAFMEFYYDPFIKEQAYIFQKTFVQRAKLS
jgi:hypothetical protein